MYTVTVFPWKTIQDKLFCSYRFSEHLSYQFNWYSLTCFTEPDVLTNFHCWLLKPEENLFLEVFWVASEAAALYRFSHSLSEDDALKHLYKKKTLHLQNLFTQIIQLHTGSQSLVKMPYLRKRWSCLCGFSWTFLPEHFFLNREDAMVTAYHEDSHNLQIIQLIVLLPGGTCWSSPWKVSIRWC